VPDVGIALTTAEHRRLERIALAQGVTVEQLAEQLTKEWLAKKFGRPAIPGKVLQMRPAVAKREMQRGRD